MADFIVKYAKQIEKIFIVLVVISLICMPFVKVNYDLAEYLPDWAPSKAGLNLMEDQFGYPGTARVMVKDVSLYQAKNIKDKIDALPGVDMVMWADLTGNIYESSSYIDYDEIKDYYKDNSAVYDVIFKYGDSDTRTKEALNQMHEITGENSYYVGPAVQTQSLEVNMAEEMRLILAIAGVIIFLILLLTTTSWFQPVLFLTVMVVAILINKGTNIFLPQISFMTDNVVAVLQLAVSMDYSIFLLHAFTRYKEQGEDQQTALKDAVNEAINSILASSLTTIVGFVVLMFMNFSIGFDLGLVLAKGVALSLAAVILFMPALLLQMEPLLTKFEHKSFLPSFKKTSHGIYKIRWIVLAVVAITVAPMYVAQGMSSFEYGNAAVGASPGTQVYADEQTIAETFGRSNMMMAIIPNEDANIERKMADEIKDLPYVKSVMSLADIVPEGIPIDFLPDSVTSLLKTDDYVRVMIYTRTREESEAAFNGATEISGIVKKYYPENSYLVGGTPSTMDIKDIITADYNRVNILSLLGVFLVVMFSFQSVLIPIIVMIPIEVAIFANMSIPYITGETMVYLGYIIVGSIQLGATVDYSILTTNNYMEGRKTLGKKDACIFALQRSIPAALTSAGILTACGYILYKVSSIAAIAGLGHLIGRGAWMSFALVVTVLPALLVAFDGVISKPSITQKIIAWIGKIIRGMLPKRPKRVKAAAANAGQSEAGTAASAADTAAVSRTVEHTASNNIETNQTAGAPEGEKKS